MKNIEIVRLNDQLEGVGYVDGKVIFIPKCKVGEHVDAVITLEKKNYLRGKIVNKENITDCPHFYECGGCSLRNYNYEDTLKIKKDIILSNLKKVVNLPNEVIVIKNDNPYFYRNKTSIKIINKIIGFYDDMSHNIFKIDDCKLLKKPINNFIKDLSLLNIENGEVIIRCNYNDELLISISTEDVITFDFSLLKKSHKIAGIVLNGKTVLNNNYFFDKIDDMFFKVSYDSFFQVNNLVAKNIFDIIKNNVNASDSVLELYSGVGTLSIVAAKKAKEVYSVEIVKNAVENSLINAKLNHIKNTNFFCGDVPQILKKINKKFDTIIVDPPRKGLDRFTLNYIMSNEPKQIIYVSCNPQTLSRDLNVLKDKYIIDKFSILDMFSFTQHAECVCVLKHI